MLIEEILERDGLIDGIWFPWLNASAGSHNLTGNDIMAAYYNSDPNADWARVELDYIGADEIYRQIYNLKTMGYNMMAYGGSIYGEGVIFENGDVVGIKQDYLDNARRLLDICQDIGMPVMWNVYFHSSSMPNYHGIDGWKEICHMLGNRKVADNYAKNFVAPLCDMLAEYPDVVALVSIADEPENEINDVGKGDHFEGDRAMYGVNQDDMVYFMKQINDTVREKLPHIARTVASNQINKAIYRDFDLDLMGHNRYSDAVGHFPKIEEFVTDADVILAEYNVGWNSYTDDQFTEIHKGFRQEMIEKGYKGGFAWCWIPNKSYVNDSDYYLLYNQRDNLSFRKSVAELKWYMDEYRAAYRGEKLGFTAPVMYANYGDGKVHFLPANGAVAYDVQRSDNGGSTWKTLAKGIATDDIVNSYLMGIYKDTDDSKPKSGYCYRVIAYDKDGNQATSKPNQPAGHEKKFVKEFVAPTYVPGIYYQKTTQTKAEAEADTTKLITFGEVNNRPKNTSSNLIKNPGFEPLFGENTWQWNTADFHNKTTIKVVTDTTAPEGKRSLLFDTTGTTEGQWYYFTVSGLTPNTDYVLSTWLKGAHLSASNKGMASVGVIDPDTGKFMTYYEYYRGYARSSRETQQIYPPAWDNQWHLRSVRFSVGDNTSVQIAVYGYGSKLWLDDIALYKNGNGVKYIDGTSAEIVTGYLYSDVNCAPSKSAVTDVRMDNQNYWKAGSGWRNGFMSYYTSQSGYGNALKYTASSNPNGLYYLKSIPVEKNTNYYISFSFKILKSGKGRIVMMDNKKTKPSDPIWVELDADIYGSDWFHYSGKFNSGAYDQIMFGVCDQGGSALIDNVRIFKQSDENGAKDLYLSSLKKAATAGYNQSASVTVNATGDGLKYKWYYKDKGASKFSVTTAYTTKTYSVNMNGARDGRQVYCVVTDKYGASRKTATTTLSLTKKALKITTQPKTVYAKKNATAKVTVKASGDGLTYTWYVKNSGKTSYTKSSVTSSTYSTKLTSTTKNRQVYCVVKDVWGNTVKSSTAILREAVSITTQPKTTYTKKNATAKVSVKASGDGLKYTWYYKNAGKSSYSKASVTSSTYSVKMSSTTKNRVVYCKVTDKYGKTVTTNKVTLREAASIVTQPKTVTVKKNSTAKVTVKASGDGLKYTWYIKNAGKTSFSKSSVTASSYSVKMTSTTKGRQVYCVVTDKYGKTVKTVTITLKMK